MIVISGDGTWTPSPITMFPAHGVYCHSKAGGRGCKFGHGGIHCLPARSRPMPVSRVHHFKKFKERNITGVLLPLLTDEKLQFIGITKVGDRMRLFEEFSVK